MSSSLFNQKKTSLFGSENQSEGMFNTLMNTNPAFANFVRDNQGLSAQQILEKYNISPKAFEDFINERRF